MISYITRNYCDKALSSAQQDKVQLHNPLYTEPGFGVNKSLELCFTVFTVCLYVHTSVLSFIHD